jgi:long-chain acyl-CoA synthetase
MYPGRWAVDLPDKPAYTMLTSGEIVTYGELDERSNRLANLWRTRGLRRGDHVAIVMENHPRFLEVVWAALRSGLIVTPVNWHLTPAEMAYIVADCGARSLITSAAHVESVAGLLRDAPSVDSVLVAGDPIPGFEHYESALAEQPCTPVADESAGTDMIYSSGTTGRPKGGVRPLPDCHPADLPPSTLRFYELFGFDRSTVYLSPGAPLYHAAALRFSVALTMMGATVVLGERFDPEQSLRAIDRHGVTHSQWVPTMFQRMLRLPVAVRQAHVGASHRMAIHAAAPCPVGVKEQMIDWWGPIVSEYYGGSEGGALTFLTSAEWLAHRGSVGRPVIGTIHITDDDGIELPAGEAGAVRFSGGSPIEYHNDPDKTAAARDGNGWATVGDIGYVDADGYLYLTDRRDFMIISGGVNIYPQESEDVLLRHPAVADAAVIGVPNDEYGEEVKAVVELLEHSNASPALATELIAWCRSHLAPFKCPRSVDFEEALPRSDAGKLYKRQLRDRYWDGHDTKVV